MHTKIYKDYLDVRQRLLEMGLALDLLERVLLRGFVGRTNCTAHDPIQTPGTEAWRHVIRGLRDELVPHGWRKDDPRGLPLVINDSLEICITAASGDDATGHWHLTPAQRNAKGSVTEAAVRVNASQSELFPELIEEELSAALPPYAFWILLINITDSVIFAELSLLAKMSGGRATFWLERIMLPTIKPDPEDWVEATEDEGEAIDVPVELKSA